MSAPFKAKLFWLIRDADTVTVEGYDVTEEIIFDHSYKLYCVDMQDFDDEYGVLEFEDQEVVVSYGSCFANDKVGRQIGFDFQSLVATGPDNIRRED